MGLLVQGFGSGNFNVDVKRLSAPDHSRAAKSIGKLQARELDGDLNRTNNIGHKERR